MHISFDRPFAKIVIFCLLAATQEICSQESDDLIPTTYRSEPDIFVSPDGSSEIITSDPNEPPDIIPDDTTFKPPSYINDTNVNYVSTWPTEELAEGTIETGLLSDDDNFEEFPVSTKFNAATEFFQTEVLVRGDSIEEVVPEIIDSSDRLSLENSSLSNNIFMERFGLPAEIHDESKAEEIDYDTTGKSGSNVDAWKPVWPFAKIPTPSSPTPTVNFPSATNIQLLSAEALRNNKYAVSKEPITAYYYDLSHSLLPTGGPLYDPSDLVENESSVHPSTYNKKVVTRPFTSKESSLFSLVVDVAPIHSIRIEATPFLGLQPTPIVNKENTLLPLSADQMGDALNESSVVANPHIVSVETKSAYVIGDVDEFKFEKLNPKPVSGVATESVRPKYSPSYPTLESSISETITGDSNILSTNTLAFTPNNIVIKSVTSTTRNLNNVPIDSRTPLWVRLSQKLSSSVVTDTNISKTSILHDTLDIVDLSEDNLPLGILSPGLPHYPETSTSDVKSAHVLYSSQSLDTKVQTIETVLNNKEATHLSSRANEVTQLHKPFGVIEKPPKLTVNIYEKAVDNVLQEHDLHTVTEKSSPLPPTANNALHVNVIYSSNLSPSIVETVVNPSSEVSSGSKLLPSITNSPRGIEFSEEITNRINLTPPNLVSRFSVSSSTLLPNTLDKLAVVTSSLEVIPTVLINGDPDISSKETIHNRNLSIGTSSTTPTTTFELYEGNNKSVPEEDETSSSIGHPDVIEGVTENGNVYVPFDKLDDSFNIIPVELLVKNVNITTSDQNLAHIEGSLNGDDITTPIFLDSTANSEDSIQALDIPDSLVINSKSKLTYNLVTPSSANISGGIQETIELVENSHYVHPVTATARHATRTETVTQFSEPNTNRITTTPTAFTPQILTYPSTEYKKEGLPSHMKTEEKQIETLLKSTSKNGQPQLHVIEIHANGTNSSSISPYVKAALSYDTVEFCKHRGNIRSLLGEWVNGHLKNETNVPTYEVKIFYQPNCSSMGHSASREEDLFDNNTNLYFYVVDNGHINPNVTRQYPRNPTRLEISEKLEYLKAKILHLELVSAISSSEDLILEEEAIGTSLLAVVISCTILFLFLIAAVLAFVVVKRRRAADQLHGRRCTPAANDAYSMDSVSMYYHSFKRKSKKRASNKSLKSYLNQGFDDPNGPSRPLNFAKLTHFIPDSEGIYDEFSNIPSVTPKYDEMPRGVEDKNRYANVIPVPETRVLLESNVHTHCEEYINANYIHGARNETRYYIATQAPLDETVNNFWQMVWEQETKVIVMLTDFVEKGIDKCADYLPPSETLDCHRVYGDFQVTLKSRDMREKYVVSQVQLKNLENNLIREVAHMWFTGWPQSGVPNEEKTFISFIFETRAARKKLRAKGPILVHCSPGTGRTGTFISCDISMRHFDDHKSVDIPKTVYRIRRERAGAVQTKEQYGFIYRVTNLYAAKLMTGNLDLF